jgi:hypothetical protein
VDKCGLLNKWILFRIPAHPRHLLPALRQIVPIVRAAADGKELKGGINAVPALYPFLEKESKLYKDSLPESWEKHNKLIRFNSVKKKWHFMNSKTILRGIISKQ